MSAPLLIEFCIVEVGQSDWFYSIFSAMKKHDALIIGAGSAGLGMIGLCQELDWSFLVVEKEAANVGGDCLNFGCVPSKALIHLGKQFKGARKAAAFGLEVNGKADMSKILDYVHSKQEPIRAHESADYLRSEGVELAIGEAHFVGSHTIEVNGDHYEANKIFICTGSHPRMFQFEGLDQVEYYTNETIFYDMKTLPDRLLVVGGGPIGCEMAQVFVRFGSKVTIANYGDRILGKEREEFSQALEEIFADEGIDIINAYGLKLFKDKHTAILETRDKSNQKELGFDAVLIAIGRGLNHKLLNVGEAGIQETDRIKIVVNDYLQTTNEDIFVLGDAAGMYQLSHGAEKHVKLLRYNFKHTFFKKKHNADDLSWVTFTEPEIATFGISEKELQDRGINYWRQDQSFEHDDRAIVGEYTYGKISLYTTRESNKMNRKILGGSILSPNAGEMMQELQLAAQEGIKLEAFMDKIYAYPTASRINQQTVMGIVNYKGE